MGVLGFSFYGFRFEIFVVVAVCRVCFPGNIQVRRLLLGIF